MGKRPAKGAARARPPPLYLAPAFPSMSTYGASKGTGSMDHLIYARMGMGLSLAFHIIFAAAGIALPLFMVIADALYLRTKDGDYQDLAKRMAKGTSILFAVGAVSGTVLSFELGLLWPSFMGTFGEVIGLPFGLEGFAFFTEAIFLGIYLYGRGKIPPKLHLLAGVGVAVSGALSAFFVTLVNAFMNLPSGLPADLPADLKMLGSPLFPVDPVAAMWSAPWKHETLHVLLASYQATAFAVAGVHAAVLLRHPTSQLFRKGLSITLSIACITAVLQLFSGHYSAQSLAASEPRKLAAIEAHFETMKGAPLRIGGVPDVEAKEIRHAIEIPRGLSLLAWNDPAAEVKGLEAFPRDEWPPVMAVHYAFDVMVGAGSAMALLAVVTAFLAFRKRGLPDSRRWLWAVVLVSPLGLVALEAGWLVTELGRQPWIVEGAMRTKDAVTPFPHLAAPFWLFAFIYIFLGVTVVYLLFRGLRRAPTESGVPSSKAFGHDH
jgi:cytochrome d ubiquinol oxidase subunit I